MELTVSEYKKLMQRIAELEENSKQDKLLLTDRWKKIKSLEAEVERLKSDNNGLRNELTRLRDWLADRQLSLVTKGLLESADAIEQQINAINDTLQKMGVDTTHTERG